MQFTSVLLAAAALSVTGAVEFTNSVFNNVTAGKDFVLTWDQATGPVSIILKNGPELALNTVQTVTTGQTGNSFSWPVPSTLAADTYAFEIDDSTGKPNYSPQFQLIGGSSASASGTTASSTSASASSASSASTSGSSSTSESTTATIATTSASTTSTPSSNSTSSSGSSSSKTSSSKSSGTATGTGSSSVPTSPASAISSPLALVLLTFAAIYCLN